MRSLLYFAAVAALVSAPLPAAQQGKLTGKVLDTARKPVPNVLIVLKRLDAAFLKEIKVDAKTGKYLQSGLEPVEYEITISAEGYVSIKDIVKIPLNDVLAMDFTLMTPEQILAASGTEITGNSKTSAGDTAYTEAVSLYNGKNFAAALEKFEVAIDGYAATIAAATDTDSNSTAEARQFHAKAVDLLADSQFEVGKADPGQRGALWPKAEPVLKAIFDKFAADDKSQDRARLAYQLGEIASMRGDTGLAKQYSDVLEKIEGPKVENAYNTAVALYNAGKLAEAKPHLKKAIEINPSFAETYYLLALCELNGGDLKAAKVCFQKYMALAPTGKYAAEVKDYLKDLKDF